MTHTASHIIISAINQPAGKYKVWHYLAAACLLCFVAGFLVGKL